MPSPSPDPVPAPAADPAREPVPAPAADLTPEPVPAPAAGRIGSALPGLGAAVALAAAATAAGRVIPLIGAPALAIVAGLVLSPLRPGGGGLTPGLRIAGRQVLQGSIVVLGLTLSVSQVASIGAGSLPVLLVTLAAALVMAAVVGRRLGLGPDISTLIGVGTAVCGASAIAAVESVIDADEADVSYAVTTIFVFNVVAVLLYPPLGHLLGMGQRSFGLFSGTAVNDTSSVVAAAAAYGHGALTYGVVTKLTRTLAIVPICAVLAAATRRRRDGTGREVTRPARARIFPTFVLGFVAAVLVGSSGLLPAGLHRDAATLATFMITVALAAIGLSSRLGHIRRTGYRPLLLGAILWATVGLASLAAQVATGSL